MGDEDSRETLQRCHPTKSPSHKTHLLSLSFLSPIPPPLHSSPPLSLPLPPLSPLPRPPFPTRTLPSRLGSFTLLARRLHELSFILIMGKTSTGPRGQRDTLMFVAGATSPLQRAGLLHQCACLLLHCCYTSVDVYCTVIPMRGFWCCCIVSAFYRGSVSIHARDIIAGSTVQSVLLRNPQHVTIAESMQYTLSCCCTTKSLLHYTAFFRNSYNSKVVLPYIYIFFLFLIYIKCPSILRVSH